MTFTTFRFRGGSLQLIYINMRGLGRKEENRYREVISNFKPSNDFHYLYFDCSAIGGIEHYYIRNPGLTGINELVKEIQEIVEYLDNNKIPWIGSRNNITIDNGFYGPQPGIICLTSKEIIFISCDGNGEIQKECFPIKLGKI